MRHRLRSSSTPQLESHTIEDCASARGQQAARGTSGTTAVATLAAATTLKTTAAGQLPLILCTVDLLPDLLQEVHITLGVSHPRY